MESLIKKIGVILLASAIGGGGIVWKFVDICETQAKHKAEIEMLKENNQFLMNWIATEGHE